MRYYASVDLMRSIIVLVIVFIGFNLSKNVLVPGFAYMISPIILAFIFIPILLKKTFPQFSKLKFSVDKVLIKKLFKFGLPVMIGGASWLVMTYTDTIMLTYFSGIKQVGLYNAALPTASLLHYFSLALATVLLPMSSELWSRGHKEQLRAGINLLYKYSFLIIIPFALIMVSFPEILLRMLFGNEYVPAATTLKILSIGTIFLIIARVNFSILSGIGKPKINAKIMWGVAVLNIMLNLMLIPFYGIIGAAIATSTSFLVMLILSTIYMERNIAIKIPLWLWLKILVIGISFVWFIAYLKKALVMAPLLEASLVIPIAALFYVSLSFIFRVVSFTEIKELINGLRL